MKLSVIVTAYNHQKYIAQCLDSVLAQEGDFQLEVIIGDDASTDGTRSIAERCQAQHPDIVLLLPREKNLGITMNLKRCLDACTGDYIAICEGDDYWTDVYKLQKQKGFLDRYADASMCFTPYLILFEERGTFTLHDDPLYLRHDFLTTEDLIDHNYIGNFSCCMYRRETVRLLPEKLYSFFTVDWMFNMACGQLGRIGLIRDPMSVYRKHQQGAWAGGDGLENQEKLLGLIDLYNEYFDFKYDRLFAQKKGQLQGSIQRLKTTPDPQAVDAQAMLDWNRSLVIRLQESERVLQSFFPGASARERAVLGTVTGVLQRMFRFLRKFRS